MKKGNKGQSVSHSPQPKFGAFNTSAYTFPTVQMGKEPANASYKSNLDQAAAQLSDNNTFSRTVQRNAVAPRPPRVALPSTSTSSSSATSNNLSSSHSKSQQNSNSTSNAMNRTNPRANNNNFRPHNTSNLTALSTSGYTASDDQTFNTSYNNEDELNSPAHQVFRQRTREHSGRGSSYNSEMSNSDSFNEEDVSLLGTRKMARAASKANNNVNATMGYYAENYMNTSIWNAFTDKKTPSATESDGPNTSNMNENSSAVTDGSPGNIFLTPEKSSDNINQRTPADFFLTPEKKRDSKKNADSNYYSSFYNPFAQMQAASQFFLSSWRAAPIDKELKDENDKETGSMIAQAGKRWYKAAVDKKENLFMVVVIIGVILAMIFVVGQRIGFMCSRKSDFEVVGVAHRGKHPESEEDKNKEFLVSQSFACYCASCCSATICSGVCLVCCTAACCEDLDKGGEVKSFSDALWSNFEYYFCCGFICGGENDDEKSSNNNQKNKNKNPLSVENRREELKKALVSRAIREDTIRMWQEKLELKGKFDSRFEELKKMSISELKKIIETINPSLKELATKEPTKTIIPLVDSETLLSRVIALVEAGPRFRRMFFEGQFGGSDAANDSYFSLGGLEGVGSASSLKKDKQKHKASETTIENKDDKDTSLIFDEKDCTQYCPTLHTGKFKHSDLVHIFDGDNESAAGYSVVDRETYEFKLCLNEIILLGRILSSFKSKSFDTWISRIDHLTFKERVGFIVKAILTSDYNSMKKHEEENNSLFEIILSDPERSVSDFYSKMKILPIDMMQMTKSGGSVYGICSNSNAGCNGRTGQMNSFSSRSRDISSREMVPSTDVQSATFDVDRDIDFRWQYYDETFRWIEEAQVYKPKVTSDMATYFRTGSRGTGNAHNAQWLDYPEEARKKLNAMLIKHIKHAENRETASQLWAVDDDRRWGRKQVLKDGSSSSSDAARAMEVVVEFRETRRKPREFDSTKKSNSSTGDSKDSNSNPNSTEQPSSNPSGTLVRHRVNLSDGTFQHELVDASGMGVRIAENLVRLRVGLDDEDEHWCSEFKRQTCCSDIMSRSQIKSVVLDYDSDYKKEVTQDVYCQKREFDSSMEKAKRSLLHFGFFDAESEYLRQLKARERTLAITNNTSIENQSQHTTKSEDTEFFRKAPLSNFILSWQVLIVHNGDHVAAREEEYLSTVIFLIIENLEFIMKYRIQ